jgi:hypothetical protein
MEKEKYTNPCEDFRIVDFGDKRLNKRLIKSSEEKMTRCGDMKYGYILYGCEECGSGNKSSWRHVKHFNYTLLRNSFTSRATA